MQAKKTHASSRPTLFDLMAQTSVYGSVIPRYYGMTKGAPKVIWAAGLRGGDSSKKGKKAGKKGAPPTYVSNIDFLIGSNPIVGVGRTWNNAAGQGLTFASASFSLGAFFGAGVTLTIADPAFYSVIGVVFVSSYSVSFNDYGGSPVTLTGSTELPMWNSEFQGPDPVDSSGWRSWPFTYRWIPGSNTVFIENIHIGVPGGGTGSIKIYYSAIPGAQTPMAFNRLSFEAQLGSGSEYTGYSAQRILYPMYAGAGSPDLDLGSGPAIPDLRFEVLGSYPLFGSGDAELADIAEDIIKMGQSQAALEIASYSNIQFGSSLYDFPGTVQKKFNGDLEWAAYYNPTYDRPNTAGNILIAINNGGLSGVATVTDAAGNTWTPVFASGATLAYVIGCVARNNNLVSFSDRSFSWEVELYEIAGVDTLDSIAQSLSATTLSVTTTNAPGQPAYIFVYAAGTPNIAQPNLWKPLIAPSSPPSFTGFARGAPTRMSTWYRIVTNPGTYTVTFSSATQCAVLAFKNSQPGSYAKALGDIIDAASLSNVRAQCRAYGLQGSIGMDSQRAAMDWLTDLYTVMNAWPVWSGFKLKSIAMAEQSTFGQGAVYTSPTASGPVANLIEGDYIDDKANGVVQIQRRAVVDSQPLIQIQHPERSDNYNSALTSEPDNGAIALRGARKKDTKHLALIQDSSVCRLILGVLVRRSVYLLNVYVFKLQAKWKLLEAGDLVTITDPDLGIVALPVRLSKVQEDEKFNLSCEAEAFQYGINTPVLNPVTANQQNGSGLGTVPAAVNTPIFIEPPTRITQNNLAQLWIPVSDPDPAYGGCVVYVSVDGGTSYEPLGEILGNAMTGVTTADWPQAADEDTTNNLLVNLTESLGTLQDFDTTQEDSFTFLCYVAGGGGIFPFELMAYGLATLTSANHYTLQATGGGNHLRRAVYGTWASSVLANIGPDHPSGSRFCYLDPNGSGILKVNLDPSWTGKTLYFKFVQFNTFVNGYGSLASATAYPYTVLGTAGSGSGGSGGGGGNSGYSLNPPSPLSNPTATSIAMAQVVATFTPSGQRTNYNARTFPITAPAAPLVYYVTIHDPGLTGDTGSAATLTALIGTTLASVNYGQAGYIYMGSVTALPGGGGSGSDGGSSSTTVPLVIGFGIPAGAPGTNVGPMLPAPRNGTLSQCVVVIKHSDIAVDLTFRIRRNGTDVFTADPTITHGATPGSEYVFATLTPSPFQVAKGDVFSIDVTAGNGSWNFTAQLE